jgi:hypothetical protein
LQPSGQPTGEPSGQPTGQPSGQPTGQPSAEPTSSPTETPYAEIKVVQSLTGINRTVFLSNENNMLSFRNATAETCGLESYTFVNVTDVMDVDTDTETDTGSDVSRMWIRRRLSNTSPLEISYAITVVIGPSSIYSDADAALSTIAAGLEQGTALDCTVDCFNDFLTAAAAAYTVGDLLATVATAPIEADDIVLVVEDAPVDTGGGGDEDDMFDQQWGLKTNGVDIIIVVVLSFIVGLPIIYFAMHPSVPIRYAKICYYKCCPHLISSEKDWTNLHEHFERPRGRNPDSPHRGNSDALKKKGRNRNKNVKAKPDGEQARLFGPQQDYVKPSRGRGRDRGGDNGNSPLHDYADML